MKLLHLSDLHLGKRVNEFSMLEDQAHILREIAGIAKDASVDAVLIAGDVYDKTVPSAEAVQLFDDFLTRLAELNTAVLLIAGNHDSPERLSFGGRLLGRCRIYVSPVFDGTVQRIPLEDRYGAACFYLLPFIKPASARRAYPEAEIDTYHRAVQEVLRRVPVDAGTRNVLLAHQFVTGAQPGGSEEISVGGIDNVDASLFEAFDYVALGHIHSAQPVARETVRYCGTPLKYSFAEARGNKSVTLVELGPKGSVRIEPVPLHPLRDLRELRGTYAQLTAREAYQGTNTGDYVHITLTDEEEVFDALGKLRAIYPRLMKLDYDNARTRCCGELPGMEALEAKTPLELFGEFYQLQNQQPLSGEQQAYVAGLIESIWEEP